jgi:DNA-binding GntR family transcriptional regulator
VKEEIFQTAPEIAYRIISQKILDGEFQPGMKLSRRKMAEVTNVSVIPVIEALKRLEEDGLVESKPQWGSFVTVPTREKIIQSYQVREAIECQSARILSQIITPEQIDNLLSIATELDTVPYEEKSTIDSRNYHLRFHNCLAEYTNNDLLVRTLNRINLFWVLCKALGARATQTEYPRYWHRKLVDEIAAGDPDRAEAAMREHVLDSLGPVLESLDEKNRSI